MLKVYSHNYNLTIRFQNLDNFVYMVDLNSFKFFLIFFLISVLDIWSGNYRISKKKLFSTSHKKQN